MYLKNISKAIVQIIVQIIFRYIFSFIFLAVVLLQPLPTFATHTSDPNVSLLQSRISKNFSKKFCNSIQNGLSKDEAITSAIIKTKIYY